MVRSFKLKFPSLGQDILVHFFSPCLIEARVDWFTMQLTLIKVLPFYLDEPDPNPKTSWRGNRKICPIALSLLSPLILVPDALNRGVTNLFSPSCVWHCLVSLSSSPRLLFIISLLFLPPSFFARVKKEGFFLHDLFLKYWYDFLSYYDSHDLW